MRSAIGMDRALDRAFIVINEKARRHEDVRPRLLHLVKLNGRGNRVCRTAVGVALIVNWGAIRSEIDSPRQSAQEFARCRVEKIAMIGKIRDPAVEKVPPPGNTRPLRRLFTMTFPRHAWSFSKKAWLMSMSSTYFDLIRVLILACPNLDLAD